ncbi:MAG: nucleotidyltransferase domain-containing protein [Candidatus Moraniibacteriota bacterium]
MRITKEQKANTAKIAKKHKLKLVVIFGSFASGKNRKDSDLDMGVIGEKEISFEKQIVLTNELSQIFKKDIDLSVLNRANPLLLFEASRNAVLVYGENSELAKFKLYAFRVYNDYAPYFKIENELNKRLIKSYAS